MKSKRNINLALLVVLYACMLGLSVYALQRAQVSGERGIVLALLGSNFRVGATRSTAAVGVGLTSLQWAGERGILHLCVGRLSWSFLSPFVLHALCWRAGEPESLRQARLVG